MENQNNYPDRMSHINLAHYQRIYVLLLVVLALIASSALMFRFQNVVQSVVIQEGELRIELSLEPSNVFLPEPLQLSWNVEGINAIYFNGNGAVGQDAREIYPHCQSLDFNIILKDNSSRNYILSPFIWTEPLNLFFICLIFVSIFGLVLSLSSSKRQSIIARLAVVFDTANPDYWNHNGRLLFRIGSLLASLLCFPLLYFPICHSVNSPGYETFMLVLTWTLCTLAFLVSMFRFEVLIAMKTFTSQYIPYNLTLLIVCLYWLLAYSSILRSFSFVQVQMAILFSAVGVTFLVVTQNKSDWIISIQWPSSRFARSLIVVFIVMLWLCVYLIPWLHLIENTFVKTAIALGMFCLPGLFLANIVLANQSVRLTQVITVGYGLSIFIAAALAILAIIFGFSAASFQLSFALVGGGVLAYLLLQRRIMKFKFVKAKTVPLFEILLIPASVLSFVVVMMNAANPNPVGDFTTYNAMVTEFAQTSQFSLQDPFLGTDNLMLARLWLFAWPVSQSLIVNFSEQNVIQSMSSLNILLVMLVATAVYDLMLSLRFPRAFAFLAVIFTAFAIVTLKGPDHVGWIFIHRLLHDKTMVAWIMTPIMGALVSDFLKQGSKRYLLLILLVSLAVVNSHAVSFFFSALICGIFASLNILFQAHKWKQLILIALVFGLCTLIPLALQERTSDIYVYETESQEQVPPYQSARLSLSDDQRLLGISPELRRGLAFDIVFIAALLALLSIKKCPQGYYLIAGCALILIVSNPITAPLLAKLITPYQLWRATWFSPFGIAGAFTIWLLFRMISILSTRLSRLFVLMVALTLSLIIANNVGNRSNNRYEILNSLIEITDYLEPIGSNNSVIILADETVFEWIPSLQWNFHATRWRNAQYQPGISENELRERNGDYQLFLSEDLSEARLDELLEKYNIQYIILTRDSELHLQALIAENDRIVLLRENAQLLLWTVE